MAALLDGQTQARAQMGVNVVCPRNNTRCLPVTKFTQQLQLWESNQHFLSVGRTLIVLSHRELWPCHLFVILYFLVQLDEMLAERNQAINAVIEFAIDDSLLTRRITGRLVHTPSGRSYHEEFYPPAKSMTDDVGRTGCRPVLLLSHYLKSSFPSC